MFVDFLLLPKLKHVRHLSSYFPFILRIDDKFPITDDKKKETKNRKEDCLNISDQNKNKQKAEKQKGYVLHARNHANDVERGKQITATIIGKKITLLLKRVKIQSPC